MNVVSTSSAPYEKSKHLGSGGSMVARLKLKGIDGSETTAKGTGLELSAGKEDPVELDSSPTL